MKRFKSIDIIRGLCIFLMVFGHFFEWWLRDEDYWLYFIVESIVLFIGTGFVFISGTASALSYNTRLNKAKYSEDYNNQVVKNEYMFRALILLIIAIIYNLATAIQYNNLSMVWSWNVLQTIAVSLFLTWPLLKTSKIFRIILGIIILIANQYILAALIPYQEQLNMFGVLFYLLFNPLGQYLILPFFSIFIIGTVVGEILFEINKIKDQSNRIIAIKKKIITPFFIIGVILIILGILFYSPISSIFSWMIYPLKVATFFVIIYSLGIDFISISVLIGIEEFKVIKVKNSYKFFFYYSYYSFTIYLAHDLLYFIFLDQLNTINIWIAALVTIFLLTLLIKGINKKFGPHLSLKIQIGRIAASLAKKFEERRRKI